MEKKTRKKRATMYEETNETVRAKRKKANERAKKGTLKAIERLNSGATIGGKVVKAEEIKYDDTIILDDLDIRDWGHLKRRPLYNDILERFDNPITIAIAFNEYVKWSKKTPFITSEMITSGIAAGTQVEKATVRPLTLEMFLAKCGMTKKVWETKKNTVGFTEVCEAIEQLIDGNLKEGGLVGLFNPSLVSRMCKLSDNIEIKRESAINVELTINGNRMPKTIELD